MKEFSFNTQQQKLLLALARQSITHGLCSGAPLSPSLSSDVVLQAPGACFVSLTIDGELRGCIGSLEPRRSLIEDVCANAYAAAFDDSRFPPLGMEELSRVKIEISILGPLEEMHFENQADLLQQIIPFRDGLMLEERGRRGTFLPLVWNQLPNKEQFFAQLKRKTGLPHSYWSNSLRCFRYQTFVIEE